MTSNDVLKIIKEISRHHTGNKPHHIPIEELAARMGITRTELINYLVDLKIAGAVDFNRNSTYLSEAMFKSAAE